MVNLCCFVWWEDEKVEWPRMGTNDYFAGQNLYDYVQRKVCKSLDNESDYALIWNPDKMDFWGRKIISCPCNGTKTGGKRIRRRGRNKTKI